MIGNLRNKIALAIFLSVGILLLAAFIFTFTFGFNQLQMRENERLRMILSGEISAERIANDASCSGMMLVICSPDQSYTVTENAESTIARTQVEQLIAEIVAGSATTGLPNGTNYRYMKVNGADGSTKIAFIDRAPFEESKGKYVALGSVMATACLFCLTTISFMLADVAIKPVEQSWKKQKRFIADASHELKTPISVILANTEILQSKKDETVQSQMQWVNSTEEEVRKLSELVANLLFLAKNDDNPTVEMTQINFSETVLAASIGDEAVFYENGKDFRYDVAEGIIVSGNKQLLSQLIRILLDNAVKYSTDRGNITLKLAANSKNAVLTVSNDCNLEKDADLSRFFDRFYTVDVSHNKNVSGTGLGLSIAKTVAEVHGGKIKAKMIAEHRISLITYIPYIKK